MSPSQIKASIDRLPGLITLAITIGSILVGGAFAYGGLTFKVERMESTIAQMADKREKDHDTISEIRGDIKLLLNRMDLAQQQRRNRSDYADRAP